MEAEATFTVQQVAAAAVMLYLCESPTHPFATPENPPNLRQPPLPSIWSARSSKSAPKNYQRTFSLDQEEASTTKQAMQERATDGPNV